MRKGRAHGNSITTLFLSLNREENSDIVEFIEEAATRVGFTVNGSSLRVSERTDPGIVEYLLSEADADPLRGCNGAVEKLIRDGYDHVQANGWPEPVLPGRISIELIRIGYNLWFQGPLGEMFREIGIEADENPPT